MLKSDRLVFEKCFSAKTMGERIPTASFNSLLPIQSSPVALEGSGDEVSKIRKYHNHKLLQTNQRPNANPY